MTGALAAPYLEVWLLAFTLILVRVTTFVSVFPLFGGKSLPRLIKIGLSISLSLFWLSTYPLSSLAALAFTHSNIHWLAFGLAVVRELIMGAMLGFAFGLLVLPARIAGSYIAQELGLTLASLADPATNSQTNAVGQLFESLAIILFFVFNIHHVVLGSLHASLQRWPVGGDIAWGTLHLFPAALDEAHEWGFLLAAPLATCLFVTLVLLVVLMKVAPQFNLFSIGLTLRLALGLVATVVFFPEMMAMMVQILQRAGNIGQWFGI